MSCTYAYSLENNFQFNIKYDFFSTRTLSAENVRAAFKEGL